MAKAPPKQAPFRRLVIVNGPRATTVFPLFQKETLIGRIDSADLVLDDPTCSRLHARLVLRRDGVWVEDLESWEGTWVNGVAVRTARLESGDLIAFGDFAVVLQTHLDDERGQ